jgi:hypothetical protein
VNFIERKIEEAEASQRTENKGREESERTGH